MKELFDTLLEVFRKIFLSICSIIINIEFMDFSKASNSDFHIFHVLSFLGGIILYLIFTSSEYSCIANKILSKSKYRKCHKYKNWIPTYQKFFASGGLNRITVISQIITG
ncbi:MAG: hypothetical protein K2G25_07060, partial [Oscillospiraceae bacterium]|nr:hypothetical protein [Oscillospiraceae bacterium]